jgi:hypoxanthine phosphoribosyltransferase
VSEIDQELNGVPFAQDGQRPAFAHESEVELARILDFYAVRWEYEPHTFPILWNLDGDVLESFSPDFYLPDLDLYLELTTLKQRLVRKKNRKLRRLRELYPEIRIKLFYARDFRALMLKYGKLGLADELSGTTGQVVPNRNRDGAPSGEATSGEPREAGSGSRAPRSRAGRRERRARRADSPATAGATSDEGTRT